MIKKIYEWICSIFNVHVPELDVDNYHVTFFTAHGGWTSFTFDDGHNYFHGEIVMPESFEGYSDYYIRWVDRVPKNRAIVERFVYFEYIIDTR